jgi:aminopeptidase N
MTDAQGALQCLCDMGGPEAAAALALFEETYGTRGQDNALVMDKWFALQAQSALPGTLSTVRALMGHPQFSLQNPNRLRSLVMAFAANNARHFHAADGSGYALLADVVCEIDAFNPQVAARSTRTFLGWKRLEPVRRAHMKAQLERIVSTPGLSKDTFEVATKALA